LNRFNQLEFEKSVDTLPQDQRWLRQGWASDCSFSPAAWELVATIAAILQRRNISLLIITKVWTLPSPEVVESLVQNQAELRTSISALDSDKELARRLTLLSDFRNAGGKAVPYLMSCRYADLELARNEAALVAWIADNDFLAAEHPLRFDSDNRIIPRLMRDGFWHPKMTNQYWFGRLYDNFPGFRLPPPTHLLPHYTLPFLRASEALDKVIPGLDGDLPTFSELQQQITKPSGNLFKHATYDIRR